MKFAYLIEPPFNYVDADGRITGCDVELARFIFAELGIAEFEPIETEFAELLPGLGKGRWRMTTGLFGTDERRAYAQFSRPIWALPDGFLVQRDNPLDVAGYGSVAANKSLRLAVIRDQFQHRSAVEFGVEDDRILVFETYAQAAQAVCDGHADAYASVGRAHVGFVDQNPELALDVVLVPKDEKPPAFGSFAFRFDDQTLLNDVDCVLVDYLGSPAHRKMAATYGFSDQDIDLVSANNS